MFTNTSNFTIKDHDPTEKPPRLPYLWVNIASGDMFLANGTDSVDNYINITAAVDTTHPSRTDNPHQVTADQIGANIAQFNANQLMNIPFYNSTTLNNKMPYTFTTSVTNEFRIGWRDTGTVVASNFDTSKTHRYLWESFDQGAWVQVYYDFNVRKVGVDLNGIASEIISNLYNAGWNLGIPALDSTIDGVEVTSFNGSNVDGAVLAYRAIDDGTGNITESVEAINAATLYSLHHPSAMFINENDHTITNTLATPFVVPLLDTAIANNDSGQFDEFGNPIYWFQPIPDTDPDFPKCFISNVTGLVWISIKATGINNTGNTPARLSLQFTDYVDWYDFQETLCLANPAGTANRYVTMTYSGYMYVTAGEIYRLVISNGAANTNSWTYLAGSIAMSIELRRNDG